MLTPKQPPIEIMAIKTREIYFGLPGSKIGIPILSSFMLLTAFLMMRLSQASLLNLLKLSHHLPLLHPDCRDISVLKIDLVQDLSYGFLHPSEVIGPCSICHGARFEL